MVTQREGTSQETLQQEPADLQDDFKIVDETPPEQIELEAELDHQAGVAPEPESETPEPEQPESVTETPEAPEVQPQPEVEAPTEPPTPAEQPPARQYSVEEVAKIQSAYDTRLKEQQQRELELQQQLDARNLEADVEASIRRQEAELAASVGEQEASRIARSETNVANIRSAHQSRQQAQRLERELAQRDTQAEEQAKQIWARQLMDQHGLQTNDYSLLLNTTTPDAMQTLAGRLATQTLNQRQQQQALQARVPAETADTRLTNGHSDGAASETPEQALARINAKQSVDWTDADWEFMRTGRLS